MYRSPSVAAESSRIRGRLLPGLYNAFSPLGFADRDAKLQFMALPERSDLKMAIRRRLRETVNGGSDGNQKQPLSGGGSRGQVKSRSSEEMHLRSRLEASSANEDTFFVRKIMDNESRPNGLTFSQGGKYGNGKLSLVAASPAHSAADVDHDEIKEFTTKGCSDDKSTEVARRMRIGFHNWWNEGHPKICNGCYGRRYLHVLSKCLVRWCKDFIKIGNLASQMQAKGFTGFSIMRAVGNAVLMIFEDYASLSNVKNDKSETLAKWFSRVEVWSKSLVVEYRRVWLVCEGVPFHAWNWDTFKNIADKWGNLLAIDESCQSPSSFDRTKIQILTKAHVRIDESLELKVVAMSF
ncbi:hypothetical protein F3Y22_tig00110776pilonHSYRG00079 [Hibiscus syriacus]|uniref:Uncharacterized protein n=1 Tax=Hibiscus syriacus TaxID=106335 RepID=A0A6A2ZRV3_HIBSY|nr:hypothetical protein F3Y22_tig00110776pilonHSYRG00079 [Hibiscus syriacus]